MEKSKLQLATIVLAAGAGTRFGPDPGGKLLAELGGRPLLAHVLEAVRAALAPASTAPTIIVLGYGAEVIERAIDWHDEIRVRNDYPERGLASSLQVGIDTLRAFPASLDGAFIVLGDQPRLRADTLRALATAASRTRPADRPVVVPSYATGGARNPVLLLRPAWSRVDELDGDHGLGALIEASPSMVLRVEVEGAMPDVDVPDDLKRLSR